MPQRSYLEILPLGGLGEFGLNLMLYRIGQDSLVVDAGMMFPGQEHLGINVLIPDLSALDDCGTLHGVILTHGHEDHIGAIPYLLARHDVPIYAPPHAQALVRGRLTEHDGFDAAVLHPLPEGRESIRLGPFAVQSLPVAHSIPQSRMIVLRTPAGMVVHTADFKLDTDPPDGMGTDLERLAELGREGVTLLLSDSTNADRPGVTPSEASVAAALDEQIAAAPHRALVTMFSSNVQRVQALARIARKYGRKMALVGSSLESQAEVAQRLGLLEFPRGVRMDAATLMELPRRQALLVAAGSQGEPLSALARIAVERHRDVRLETGDVVIHSARRIPGNEKSIGRMINRLIRRGAEVVTGDAAPVHASGHPSRDELRRAIELLRPQYLVPIHGEYRQLHAHAALAVECGMDPGRVLLVESGDRLVLGDDGLTRQDSVPVGQVCIDAAFDEVHGEVLRDRRRSAGDGIVVPVLTVDRNGAGMAVEAEIVTRGFVPGANGEGALMQEARQIVTAALAAASPEERADEAMLKARIHTDLKRFLRRRTQRRPLIIPVIVGF